MKNFIKENFIAIIFFAILVGFGIYQIYDFDRVSMETNLSSADSIIECLQKYEKSNPGICDEMLKMHEEAKKGPDFYNMSFTVINKFSMNTYVMFFVISIPVLYNVCRIFRNKHLIYELTRENYKKFKRSFFKKAYLSSMILALSILVVFIITIIYCKGFSTNSIIAEGSLGGQIKYSMSPIFYIFTVLYRVFVAGIIYTNFSLIVARKNHNFYIANILSYLLFIGTEAVLEGLGDYIFYEFFHIDSMIIFINMLNIFNLNLGKGIIALYLPLTIILIGTSIIVYLKYRNKEKLIIDCEKNG